MAVSLTKPMHGELFPQNIVEEIYPQKQATTAQNVSAEVVTAKHPPSTTPPANCKTAVVTHVKGNTVIEKPEDIPLNDLTALDVAELRALTQQSIKEIEDAFALIQRVAAEGERRAELDDMWGDSYYSDVSDFHRGVVQKIISYHKRHKKKHPWIYRKEHSLEFYVGVSLGTVGLGAAIPLFLHFLGLWI